MPNFLRPLGDTGLTVSAIGLGTVKLGRDQGVKYPQGFTIPDDHAARRLLDEARDLRINLIDTAPAYGVSEERLGRLLTQRQDWVIVTKVGEEFENGQSHFDFSPEHVRFSIERSLARLRTDYLDIVLVHSDGNDMALIEQAGTLEALTELKRKGLIRAIGMSTKTVEGGLATLERADVAMVTYQLGYDDELPVIEYAAAHNKGILVKKAFASGHLDPTLEDPIQASLNHIFGTPGVTSVIAGTINPVHLRENASKARHALGGR